MSTAAALLDLTLDTAAAFLEPAPFLWAKAVLDTVEEGADRGEEALGEYLAQQGEAMRAQLVQKYQKKISAIMAEFDARIAAIQDEADAAVMAQDAAANERIEHLSSQLKQVVEMFERQITILQAEIDRLKGVAAESRK